MSFVVSYKKVYIIFLIIFIFNIRFDNFALSQNNSDIIDNIISENQINLTDKIPDNIDNIITQNQFTTDTSFNTSENSIINDIIHENQFTPTTRNIHIKTKMERIIPLKQKKFIVIIDPGHGGIDPGTIGVHYKTFEKNLTLEYAKSLQKKLSNKQYIVYLTSFR